MQKEILFRGLRKDGQGWVEGFYAHYSSRHEILVSHSQEVLDYDLYPVHPETVGQYTGLTDKNGVKIFEWDKVKDCITGKVYVVKYGVVKNLDFIGWYCENESRYIMYLRADCDTCQNNAIEVIGNIHEGGNNG